MTGYGKPNYTQVPNILFDEELASMKYAELKVVLAVCRNTIGWHKRKDRISFGQLQRITGLSKQGLTNGIQDAMNSGRIVREETTEGFVYSLDIEGVYFVTRTGQSSRHTKEIKKERLSAYDKTTQTAYVRVLAKVAGMDSRAKSVYGRLSKVAKDLWRMDVSPEDVLEVFGEGGEWYRSDFRGKKGQKPVPEWVVSHYPNLRKQSDGGAGAPDWLKKEFE